MAVFRPSGISVNLRQDLAAGASRSGTTLVIDPIITKDGRRVTMADIGDICFAKLDQGTSNEEIISFTGITDNTSTYTLTGCVWGYNFYNTTSSVAANQKKHVSGGNFIITNDDHFQVTQYINRDDDQAIAGEWTFAQFPVKDGGLTPTSSDQFATKDYVDGAGGNPSNYDQNVIGGDAGETVAAGEVVYLKEADGEWYLADASTSATCENVILGIAQGAGVDGVINSTNLKKAYKPLRFSSPYGC